jgi:hypothetical protein
MKMFCIPSSTISAREQIIVLDGRSSVQNNMDVHENYLVVVGLRHGK